MKPGRFMNQPLNLPKERWHSIHNFENYEVSNFGRIRNGGLCQDGRKKTPRIMSPSRSGNIILRQEGKGYSKKIAQIVLRTFKGHPPSGKHLARHLNDDPIDNRLSNLAWGNHQDNYNDGVRNKKHGPGTSGAKTRGDKLRGKPRPPSVRQKISRTKQRFPERQSYGGKRGAGGRFVS